MLTTDKELTEKIIGAAIEVHRTLGGPGLREEVYKLALNWELMQMGLTTEMEAPVPIIYKGYDLSVPDHPLRIDILVENRVVVECKSISKYNPIFAAQCLTYLRLSGRETGLVINFGMETVAKGLERVVNSPLRGNTEMRVEKSPRLRTPCFAEGGKGERPLRGNTEQGDTEMRDKKPPRLRTPCFAEGVVGVGPLRGNTENGDTEMRDKRSPCLRTPCFAEGGKGEMPLRGNTENGDTEMRDKKSPCIRTPCFAEGVVGVGPLRGNTEQGDTEMKERQKSADLGLQSNTNLRNGWIARRTKT